jgi:Mn-dependent DtxR family transcriptional regulator
MTTTRLLGQDIGQAAAATRIHAGATLAAAGSHFEEWYPLRLLATGTPGPREVLVTRLAAALDLRPERAAELLDRLEAHGWAAATADGYRLTEAGDERYGAILQRVTAASLPLYEGLDPADVDTTARVLATVAARAREAVRR